MRIRIALLAALAALASVLAVPTAAHAAADSLACSAAGSYSRNSGGVWKTFWLVGTVGSYRYWQVENAYSGYYEGSYVVRCSGETIATSTDLAVTANGGERCGTSSSYQYQFVGERPGLAPALPFPVESDYHYWHVSRFVTIGFYGFWMYDHSELARCPSSEG